MTTKECNKRVDSASCPCPPDCRDKMKKMYRYLKDTHAFLKACDKCPLAIRMLATCDELLKDFECPFDGKITKN